jgi:hypothetical protein
MAATGTFSNFCKHEDLVFFVMIVFSLLFFLCISVFFFLNDIKLCGRCEIVYPLRRSTVAGNQSPPDGSVFSGDVLSVPFIRDTF